MIAHYFEAAHTLARLRCDPIGPFVDDFAGWLCEAGYARLTVRSHLCAVAHLGMWMRRAGLAIESFGELALEAFAAHGPVCGCLRRDSRVDGPVVAGARLFFKHLRDRGIGSPAPPRCNGTPDIIERFEQWMCHHRGVAPATLVAYRRVLIELVRKNGTPDGYTASTLREFVSDRAAQHGRSHAKMAVTAVRMYLRYLAVQGMCEARLVDAIPTFAGWRLSALPAYMVAEDVERLVGVPDPTTPLGRRDRAILLLLARLGLRAGDIVALRLPDIDWTGGTLLVMGKGRRCSRLPLPQDVGDALLAHLAPRTVGLNDDHVFLRACAPPRPFRSAGSVSSIVNRAAKRAGITPPRGGAHVLRHSLATAMVRGGIPLAAVGALLRHRSDDTTALYAKVDVETLRKVARPWPVEVSPC